MALLIKNNINFNIIKESIARPPAAYDAHLYSWKNLNINKQYLGVHKGAVDDDYAHSSTCEEFKKHLNDPDIPFEFSVLEYGSWDEVREKEHSILADSKMLGTFKKDYYNKHTGQFKYKGPDLKKIIALYNQIVKIKEDGSSAIFEESLEDLSIHEDMKRIQCRYKTIDKDNQKEITQKLIDSNGDISNCNNIVVFDGLTRDEDRRGNGTHTVTSCVASKLVSKVPVLRVPYENHKHLTELERKRVCSLLNKPAEIVRKETDWMDMAKDLKDNYVEHQIEPSSSHNKAYMDEVGLSEYFQDKAIDMSIKLIAADALKAMNFINWAASPDEEKLEKEVDDYNKKDDYCSFLCSSAAFKANRPLELFEETNKKNCMVIMYHPTIKAERKWNDIEEEKDEFGKITQKFREGEETKWKRRFSECLNKKYKVHFIQKDMWESDGTK